MASWTPAPEPAVPTPPATCLTPAALSAGGAPHAALPALPPGIGVGPASGGPPRPPVDRTHYGTPYDDHLDTAHFTINWAPGAATLEQAEAAGVALERAWEAYAAAGWPAPVSSDSYFLWVLLDPELGGTGLTAEYYTDEYPQGYPVIWLNPLWAEDAPFFASLASHELHHAVQYAMRETWAPRGESWMWEATAGWASWLVEPDTRAIDYTIEWYAADAHLAADTMNSGHEYGMAAFTQHLDLTQGGPEAIRDLWEAGATDPSPWVDLLPGVYGEDAGTLFARFAVDYANDSYGGTARWADPPLHDPEAGPYSAEAYGSRAYAPEGGGRWTLVVDEGEAVIAGPDTVGDRVDVAEGEVFTVTATSPRGATWRLEPTVEDSGGPDDGGADLDDTDGGDGGTADAGGAGETVADGEGGGKGGGCASAPGLSVGWALIGVVALIALRRRG
jgi:hypothetical protein